MDLVQRIQELSGIAEAEAARDAARAVIAVLFEQLSPQDRTWLARKLPAGLHIPHVGHSVRSVHRLEEFFERVASRESIEPALAVEHARSVCRALAEGLDEDDQRVLTGRLPDVLADLFDRSTAPHTLPATGHARKRRRTLAEARPGSRSPLSEAGPPPAHQDSVALSDNPHGDTKLSSNTGTTQEREDETLAEAQPNSDRQSNR